MSFFRDTLYLILIRFLFAESQKTAAAKKTGGALYEAEQPGGPNHQEPCLPNQASLRLPPTLPAPHQGLCQWGGGVANPPKHGGEEEDGPSVVACVQRFRGNIFDL